MASTLQQGLAQSAEKYGENPAVILPNSQTQLTYNEFKKEVESLQLQLQSYLQPGDVAAIVLENGLPFLLTFFSVTSASAIASPLNPQYKSSEFEFYLEDTHAKLLLLGDHEGESEKVAREVATQKNIPVGVIVWEPKNEVGKRVILKGLNTESHEQSLRQAKESEVALFLHTSGTTSKPKGVPLTHLNLSISATNIVKTYQLSSTDRTYVVMPLFHVHGLLGATVSTLFSGGAVIVPQRFSASQFWAEVVQYHATWYSAVPTIHQILLLRAENGSDKVKPPHGFLRFIRSCSSSLAPSVLEQLEDRFGAPVLEAYGMTEAAHQMSSNPLPQEAKRKPGTVGKGTNVDIAILDDNGKQVKVGHLGEVSIRGKNVTSGYHNNPAANEACFTPDGWFRTGDQGYLDEESYLHLTGRIKELINRGGEKISPVELDAVLLQHPSVAEAVVFAVPDEKYGEEVNAAVVLKEGEGVKKVDEEELKKFCGEKVVSFKVPKRIFFSDKLPRTATGKIQRRFVAAHFLSLIAHHPPPK